MTASVVVNSSILESSETAIKATKQKRMLDKLTTRPLYQTKTGYAGHFIQQKGAATLP